MMSRYEMAQVVAKAMAHSDKADAAQKAAIDKLSVEFASELEGLNVRVSKIEKNASSVKITGEARVRFENTENTPADASSHSLVLRTRLGLSGNINDNWSYVGRIANEQNLMNNNADKTTDFDIAYVKGHIGSIETTIGRQEYMPNYGLFLDTSMDGVKFSFGNVVKTNIYYGSNNSITAGVNTTDMTVAGAVANNAYDTEVLGADFTYGVTKDTNIVASIFQMKNTSSVAGAALARDGKVKIYNVGFDTKLSADWTAKAAYGQVDTDGVNGDNKAYLVGFNYKGADKAKVGSYGAFVSYRDIQKNAQIAPTFDKAVVADGQGGKGYEVGFNYVPMANSVFTAKYVDLKSNPGVANVDKAKFFQAQIEMFF